ncbi:MAG: hypothetical protein HYS12_14540 [Planctomycetes bacterium]|nr:hypothetical protein [Planctomycetota bacterium]
MSKKWLLALGLFLASSRAGAAELIFPQNRSAFYSDEPIEVAVAGLGKGATALVEFVPNKTGLTPLRFEVKGDGSTPVVALPPRALAPSEYSVRLDSKEAAKLTVASGVNVSTMLLSQTVADPKAAGGNFFLGNAFSFGLLDPQGQPLRDVRGHRSAGLEAFERAVKADLPTLVYMYWTGYVTHKPFGSEKSWPAEPMIEATRLLSFHTAQRLRRYARNVHAVGTLDEPGLSWGKTPAGGLATGFPNWDEKDWYEKRGWKYTGDPASRTAGDWLKYMTIRCAIMKEVDAMAKRDLKSIWPEVVFSTDLYAPQAIMDGTDPLNQQVNDVPSSHVFLDWGTGRSGALSGIYLEKAHDPLAKLAHAMNGQLFATPVPQPTQRNTYHLMRNAMLAAGLHSNWWLNPTGMGPEDLAAVNEPGLRLGPLFEKMQPRDHDVAVLWSFTEIALRCKDVTSKEAKKKTGEQIKQTIASLPETVGVKDNEVPVSAYDLGGNYKEQVLGAHHALTRAGYAAHIIHERLLSSGALKRYKTLVIVGQTFDLPDDVKKAINDFVRVGGKIVVDKTTTVKFDSAVVSDADWRDPAFRWSVLYRRAEKKDHGFKSEREASYHHTNHFMDKIVRDAVAPTRAAMKKTDSKPVLETDSVDLLAERHSAGEGALYMVLNAHEELPVIAADKRYDIYNYAPYKATYTLKGIKPGSVVFRFDGVDWKTWRRVPIFAPPQTGEFAPGEMKLYVVAPRIPGGLDMTAATGDDGIRVRAVQSGIKAPWQLTVTVAGPDGKELYRVYRSIGENGSYAESFPIGSNAPAGQYKVTVQGSPWYFGRKTTVEVKPRAATPSSLAAGVRVFDADAIRKFLTSKPEVVIAIGKGGQEGVARKLAEDLSARGVKATVKPESEVLRKVRYPRVWNPYAHLYTATGPTRKPAQEAKLRIEVRVDSNGKLTAKTRDGKDVSADWRLPESVVTIAGEGLVDFSGDHELCFEPGVMLSFDDQRRMSVVHGEMKEVRTTEAFRKKWAKPWDRLTSHAGAYQLPPSLPEAYTTDSHLILLGDSTSGTAVAALQASELLPQVVDARYPGLRRALVSFAWSPFAVEKNVILVGAADQEGLKAGTARLVELVPGR